MNFKVILTGVVMAGAVLFTSCGQKEAKTTEGAAATNETTEVAGDAMSYSINAEASTVGWTGTMLGLYSHNGTVALKEGNVELNGNNLVGGSFTIDLSAITPLDEGYGDAQGSRKEDLIGHLSSPDFFDVANFPTATFTIKSVSGNTAKGILNLRGTEGEETVENISITEENGVMILNGDITFNRKSYGAMFDMPVADKVLSDDIKIDVSLKTQA